MARKLFTSSNERLHVTSYAGPANTLERTRMRLQFDTIREADNVASIGYEDALTFYQTLGEWLAKHRPYGAGE